MLNLHSYFEHKPSLSGATVYKYKHDCKSGLFENTQSGVGLVSLEKPKMYFPPPPGKHEISRFTDSIKHYAVPAPT